MLLFSKKYSLMLVIFTALGTAAAVIPAAAPQWLRMTLFSAYLLGAAAIVGKRTLPHEQAAWRVLWGILLIIASLAATGAAAYFIVSLGPWMRIAVIAAAPYIAARIAGLGAAPDANRALSLTPSAALPDDRSRVMPHVVSFAAAAISIALSIAGLSLAAASSSTTALRTPWDAVPSRYFVLIFFAAVSVVTAAFGGVAGPLAIAALGGSILSVAAVVYSVGFGFDPFIHRAAERFILAHGVLSPKTPYYLGQYALVTVAAAAGGLDVGVADRFLLPALFLFVPFVAYWSIRRGTNASASAAAVASALVLLIPLAPFAATTPQGIADLFALLTVFAAIPTASGALPKGAFALLVAAVIAIHPLAGIPVAVFAAIVFILAGNERPGKLRVLLAVKIAVIGALALPAMFVLNSALSSAGVRIDASLLRSPSALIENLDRPQTFSRRFIASFDIAYAWRDGRAALIVLAAAAGIALMRRRGSSWAFCLGAGVVAANYVLLSSVIRFPFLIDYERMNYADRLGDLGLIILAPPAAVFIAHLVSRMRSRGFPAMRVAFALFLAAAVTSSVYLAYPRRDRYDTSRGWSTGASDIAAVRSISKDANGTPYIVLANQSVSAAAIDQFGFARYYDAKAPGVHEQVFYYPVPTGGPLYQLFLDMNAANGSRSVARKAMDLAGVDLAYFIVNDYWWNAQTIVNAAKRSSDGWWSEGGRVYVFRYRR